jgi:hypothetical protein
LEKRLERSRNNSVIQHSEIQLLAGKDQRGQEEGDQHVDGVGLRGADADGVQGIPFFPVSNMGSIDKKN